MLNKILSMLDVCMLYNDGEYSCGKNELPYGAQFVTVVSSCSVFALAVAIGFAAVSPVYAQTASQILPPQQWELRTRTDGFRPSIALPDTQALNAPAGAEKLNVTPSGVTIKVDNGGDNSVAAPRGDIMALNSRLANKQVSVADIFKAAQEYEQSFIRAGYPLMRVVVPAQNLGDGQPLQLTVINGYIESIDTTGMPRQIQRRVERVMTPLIGKRSVTMAEIERRLLLAGDTPGASIRSSLAAGGNTGGAKLTLEAEAVKYVEGVASVTNNLTPQSGRWLGSASFGFNSILGLGEKFQLNIAGSPKGGRFGILGDDPSVRMFGASMIMPLGNNGLALHLDGQSSKALSRTGRNGVPVSQSRFEHLSMALSYPLLRKRSLTTNAMVRFDVNDERVNLAVNNLPLSYDRMRVLRVSSDTTWFTPWNGLVWGRATASLGIDALGARSASDANPLLPLSRQGADAQFKKIEAGIGYSQIIKDRIGIDISAMGQTSFGSALVNSEQMGLANTAALSSFYSGAIQGDTAGYLRFEVSAPFTYTASLGTMNLKPYLFAAGGIAKLEQPTILEDSIIRAASFGTGLVVGLNPAGSRYRLSFAMEWGQQLRSDQRGMDDRVNLEMKLSF